MAGVQIEFTRNFSDLSTGEGFQFEFYCNRCGSGYRTEFDDFATAKIAGGLSAISNLLGGRLGGAVGLGEHVRSASWERAHDKAFAAASEQLRPAFVQCPRCSSWVCRQACWNDHKSLCKTCSPDLGVEMAAAQSSRTVQEIWAHSKMAEEDRAMLRTESWRQGAIAACPACEEPLAKKVRFCPDCGAEISPERACQECGSDLSPGQRFCGECGAEQ